MQQISCQSKNLGNWVHTINKWLLNGTAVNDSYEIYPVTKKQIFQGFPLAENKSANLILIANIIFTTMFLKLLLKNNKLKIFYSSLSEIDFKGT